MPAMTAVKPATRLYIDDDLSEGSDILLSKPQAHLLKTVLRLDAGAAVLLFNGRDGEWLAIVEELDKKRGRLRPERQTRAQTTDPDIWLAFAPIKSARIDWLAEKASELGVARLLPVMTRRTVVDRVNCERLQANAREAAEQSERLSLPLVEAPCSLAELLAQWPAERSLLLADEAGSGSPLPSALTSISQSLSLPLGLLPLGLLVGPEGGFTPDEREMLLQSPAVTPVSLGPRILRAETAALAVLAVVQSLAGDGAQQPR